MDEPTPLKCAYSGCGEEVTAWSPTYWSCDAHSYRYILAAVIRDIRRYYPTYVTLQDFADAAEQQMKVVDDDE